MATTAGSALRPNGEGGDVQAPAAHGVDVADDHGHARDVQRNISKLVDLRGLAKLTPFSGAEVDWPDWRFRTRALGPLLGLSKIFDAAERSIADPPEETWSDEDRTASQLLWSILSQTLQGRAYSILRLVSEGKGATAWYRIYQDYQMPTQIPKQMAILVGLLEPKFGSDVAGFLDRYLAWERRVEELAANSGIVLPESIRCAILMTKSPKPIRHYLENQAMIVQTSYQAMRHALQLYLYRMRSFDSEGTGTSMEVDELWQSWYDEPDAEEWDYDAEDWEDYEDDDDEGWLAALYEAKGKGKGKKGKGKGGKSKGKDKPSKLAVVPGQVNGPGNAGQQRWRKWKAKKKFEKQSGPEPQVSSSTQPFASAGTRQQLQTYPSFFQGATGSGSGEKKFGGNCFRCGKQGHRAQECRFVFPVVEEEAFQPYMRQSSIAVSEAPSSAMALQRRIDIPQVGSLQGPLSFQSLSTRMPLQSRQGPSTLTRMLCQPEHEEEVVVEHLNTEGTHAEDSSQNMWCSLLLVDSGTWVHCCRKEWGAFLPIIPFSEDPVPIVTADGTQVKKYGWRKAHCDLGAGVVVEILFEVLGIRRPILAVNMLNEAGYNVLFPTVVGSNPIHAQPCMWNSNHTFRFLHVGALMYLPVYLQDLSQSVVAPLEEFVIPDGAEWLLVEWYCDENSGLAQWFLDHGQCVWRMSFPNHDVRDDRQRKLALQIVQKCLQHGLKIFVWYSFEHRDWCAWQWKNYDHGDEDFHDKLVAGRLESKKMISDGYQFYVETNILAEKLHGKSQDVRDLFVYGAFEWPFTCKGWQQNFMQPWIAIFPCTVAADGFMLDIVGADGSLVRKRWKIKTDFLPLVVALRDCVCNGAHYQELVSVIGNAIVQADWRGAERNRSTDSSEPLEQAVDMLVEPCGGCGLFKLPDVPCFSTLCTPSKIPSFAVSPCPPECG